MRMGKREIPVITHSPQKLEASLVPSKLSPINSRLSPLVFFFTEGRERTPIKSTEKVWRRATGASA